MLYYFDSKKTASSIKMGKMLSTIVSQTILPEQEIIILCIGSDRSTGDSLGPLSVISCKVCSGYNSPSLKGTPRLTALFCCGVLPIQCNGISEVSCDEHS